VRPNARRFLGRDARTGLREFSLSLAPGQDPPDRVRPLCGAEPRESAGLGKPGTFTFLGFVLICGKSRRGRLPDQEEVTPGTACARNCGEVKEGAATSVGTGRSRKTGNWLGQIVAGYFAYHAVPTNSAAIGAFRYHVTVLWYRQLCRPQPGRARLVWSRMAKAGLDEFLPKSRRSFIRGRVARFAVRTRGRSRVPELGSLGSGRGGVQQ